MCLLSADFQRQDMVFGKNGSNVNLYKKKRKKRQKDFMPALSGKGVVFIVFFFFLKIIGNIWSPCVLQVFSSVTFLFFFAVGIHAVPGITHRSGV